MPFTCIIKDGLVDLQRSEPISYPIVGRRKQRALRVCSKNRVPSDIRDCRMMILHQFSIPCGGRSVDWATIAAAIPKGSGVLKAWLEDGTLNLALKPRWRAIQSNLGRVLRQAAPSRDLHAAHFVFPKHYAPIEEVGARLHRRSGQKKVALTISDVIVPPEPSYLRVAISNTKADSRSTPVAAHDNGGRETLLAGTNKTHWDTIVITGENYAGPFFDEGHRSLFSVAFGLLLLITAWFVAFPSRIKGFLRYASIGELSELAAVPGPKRLSLAQRWIFPLRDRLIKLVRKFGALCQDLTTRNGVVSVEAQIKQVRRLVSDLDKAPLRETLEGELRGLEHRVGALSLSNQAKSDKLTVSPHTARALRNIIREVNRIRRIAESAAVSLTDQHQKSFMPQTKSEAFQLLGVHSNASDATLKKVIDGLRMSWHPDLARNDEDREVRNERIKQINRAWELVSRKSCSDAHVGHQM